MDPTRKNQSGTTGPAATSSGFWEQNKSGIGLALLTLYVFLLGLGTIGEIWEIEWILDLPLFRPPGKY